MECFDRVMFALQDLRVGYIEYESQVCDEIAKLLDAGGIGYRKEVKLGGRSRVDFMTDCGVAIEVKKGKPSSSSVSKQVERYASFDVVEGVVLVTERGLFSHKSVCNGKKVGYIALSKNWGISI